MEIVVITNSKEETVKLGEEIAKRVTRGDVITLSGDLGAGKTTLVSGVAAYLGVKEHVQSPTFNILKCYFDAKIPLYHIDAYRLEDGNKDIGLEEFIEGDGVCFIEWPQFIEDFLCIPHMDIIITNIGEDKREVKLILPNEHFENEFRGFN